MVFEFLKKFGFGNIGNYGYKKINDGSDKSVTYVLNRETRKAIDEWMKMVEIDKITFGELLYKLGFEIGKKLYFKIDPEYKTKISLSYGYEENVFGDDILELDLSKTYSSGFPTLEPDSYKITLSGNNYERIYRIKTGISLENGIELTQVSEYIDERNGIKNYIRRIEENGFRIHIKHCFYDEIRLTCNKSSFLGINNEEELKEYLLNLDDVTVSEIYRKICEISLGDENEYDKIDLSLCNSGITVGNILFQTRGNCSIFDPKYKYEIFENENKVSFSFSPSILEVLNSISRSNIEFINNDYRIDIKISLLVSEKELTKILPLRSYLMGLEFPVKIDELCKSICDMFLMDINTIPYLRVELFYKDESTDLIHLEDGKLISFQKNKNGKIVKVDKDGIFSYVSNSQKRNLSVDMNQDVVTRCEVISDIGIESDNMGNAIYNGINEAKDEKKRTRKMLDDMFN